jgi:hypothetical protein
LDPRGEKPPTSQANSNREAKASTKKKARNQKMETEKTVTVTTNHVAGVVKMAQVTLDHPLAIALLIGKPTRSEEHTSELQSLS